MPAPNPYESPSEVKRTPARHNRVCGTILAAVLVNVALTASNAVRVLPDLTIAHHVIWAVLWVAVPLGAVLMVWRGRAAGRWILVGLFGLRGIGALCLAGSWLPLVTRHPALALSGPWRFYAIESVFYGGATLWLLCLRRPETHASRDGVTFGRVDVEECEK